MDLLLAFVIAMVVTMALIPPLVRVAARLQVLDDPASRKVHTQPIPRVGGIAMVVGSLLPLCLWLPMDRTLVAYLLAVIVLLVFGAWDDRVTLSPRTKFVGQLIAVLIVMLVGHVSIDTMMLGERVALPDWLGFGLTLLFLLGITNAINLSDGLDGLAGGTTLLCCAALALLGQSWDVRFVETVGVVLMGAILGFLRFNTYPARIFMGDAGSQFLGFSVGVLSILLTKQTATPLSTALPLLLIGLPVLDTLIVIVLRLHAGRSPFAADRQHFHHRLLALGLDHHEAVIVIYAVQCLLLLLAWQLRFENDVLIVATFLRLCGAVHRQFYAAGARRMALAGRGHGYPSFTARATARLARRQGASAALVDAHRVAVRGGLSARRGALCQPRAQGYRLAGRAVSPAAGARLRCGVGRPSPRPGSCVARCTSPWWLRCIWITARP